MGVVKHSLTLVQVYVVSLSGSTQTDEMRKITDFWMLISGYNPTASRAHFNIET